MMTRLACFLLRDKNVTVAEHMGPEVGIRQEVGFLKNVSALDNYSRWYQ